MKEGLEGEKAMLVVEVVCCVRHLRNVSYTDGGAGADEAAMTP